jgi:hypothetical protein
LRSRAILLAALVCLLAAPAARADGDPASDYLLSTSLFETPGVPSADDAKLRAVIAAANAGGFTIRVALISTRYDMGSVDALFRRPRQYARFLGQELYFVYKGRLLVVMPNGYGVSRGGKPVPSAQRLVDRLPSPGPGGHALATGATAAVRRLAAAAGVRVALSPPVAKKSHNGDWFAIGIIGLLVLVGAGASVVVWTYRGR